MQGGARGFPFLFFLVAYFSPHNLHPVFHNLAYQIQRHGLIEWKLHRAFSPLRLTRFAGLLPQLLSQKQQPLARADLRYTNGFALSWKQQAPGQAGSPPDASPSASKPEGFVFSPVPGPRSPVPALQAFS